MKSTVPVVLDGPGPNVTELLMKENPEQAWNFILNSNKMAEHGSGRAVAPCVLYEG